MNKLAELLLEKEVIFSEDLENIFGKRKGAKEILSVKPAEESKPAELAEGVSNVEESKEE